MLLYKKIKVMIINVIIHGKLVIGVEVDGQTKCKHYASERDVIAIKFKCCNHYYPCIKCHNEKATHVPVVWNKEDFNSKAILCGVCGYELTINEYLCSQSNCPKCKTAFNPGCQNHYHHYFDV